MERATAIRAVLSACQLTQSVLKQLRTAKDSTLIKSDKSPVTVADFGAQAIVNHVLHSMFPNDKIVGEEDAQDLRDNPVMKSQVVDLVRRHYKKDLSESDVLEAIDLGTVEGGGQGRFWTLDPIGKQVILV